MSLETMYLFRKSKENYRVTEKKNGKSGYK
jgi:hypothetical protein